MAKSWLKTFVAFTSIYLIPLQIFARENPATSLSLEILLSGLHQKTSLSPLEQKLQDKVRAQVESNGRFFKTPLQLDLEGDAAFSKDGERKITATLKRTMAFGLDKRELEESYKAESESALFLEKNESRAFELDLAKGYVSLRFFKKKAETAAASLKELSPQIQNATRAARMGTMSGLLTRQWQVVERNLLSDLEEARQSFATASRTLGRITGREISRDPFALNLADLPAIYQKSAFNKDTYLPFLANLKRQRSLSLKANQALNKIEIEGGFGMFQNASTNESGIVLQIGIPLASGTYAAAEARELRAEKEALEAQNAILSRRATQQFEMLASNAEVAANRKKLSDKRLQDVTSLYGEVLGLYGKGQAELGEVIELLKELYEVKLKMTEANKEWEENLVTMYFFAAGDKP